MFDYVRGEDVPLIATLGDAAKKVVYILNKKTKRVYALSTLLKGPLNVVKEGEEFVLLGTDACSPTTTKIKLEKAQGGEYAVAILNKWRKGWIAPEDGHIRLGIRKLRVLAEAVK